MSGEKELWEKTQERMKEVAGNAVREETEEMMREQWRQQPARRVREEEEDQGDQQQEKPPRKKRRGAYEGDKSWGTAQLGEEKIKRSNWLKNDKTDENKEQTGLPLKQTKIRAWTMTELMSRKLVRETLDMFWKVVEEKVNLKQGEVGQEAEAGKVQEEVQEGVKEGVGDKMAELPEQKGTKAEKKKPTINHDIRDMIKNHKHRAAARREEIRSRREEELILTVALVAAEEQENKREAIEQRQRIANEQKESLVDDIRDKDKELAKERTEQRN